MPMIVAKTASERMSGILRKVGADQIIDPEGEGGTRWAPILLSAAFKDFYELTNETLKTVGPILFVTAAGGVLGKVISSSNLIDFIKNNAQVLKTMGYLFPFLLAAILKTAQGSSTVAITTSAGIIAPIMQSIGFVTPVSAALVVVAIGVVDL